MVRLAGHPLKAALRVDGARRRQVGVGPQHQLGVTLGAGEGDAFVGQPPAQAQPARGGRQDQQAQQRLRRAFAHHEDRAHALAVQLGDPAALPRRVVRAQHARDDLGHQRLEFAVPAELAGVQRAVLLDHPAHVAGARLAQHGGAGRRLRRGQQAVRGAQRGHQLRALVGRERGQQIGDLLARALLQRLKHRPAGGRQRQLLAARVIGVRRGADPALLRELAQHAAEVARVQRQIACQIGRRARPLVRQLIQDAHLGQRQRAAQVRLQHADALGVRAVEGTQQLDVGRVYFVAGHAGQHRAIDCLKQLIAC